MTSTAGGHTRLYRGLLHLYPADFRSGYTDQMVQLFTDQLRDEGPTRSWLHALGDIPSSAASEHLRRNRNVAHTMTVAPTPTSRVLGVLGVVGGGILLIGFLGIAISPDNFNLRLVLFNLGAIAVVIAVHQRQSPVNRQLALAGAIPAIVSNALYLALIVRLAAQPGELGPGDYGPYIGPLATAMWLSDAWFGLVTLRLGVVSRLSSLALIVGSLFAFIGQGWLGIVEQGTMFATVVLAGIALHGLAWMMLGLEVAFRRRSVPAPR